MVSQPAYMLSSTMRPQLTLPRPACTSPLHVDRLHRSYQCDSIAAPSAFVSALEHKQHAPYRDQRGKTWASVSRRRQCAALNAATVDQDFIDAIDEVRQPFAPLVILRHFATPCMGLDGEGAVLMQSSNRVLSVMLKSDKAQAVSLTSELQDMRQILEEEGDADSSRFLKVLQVHQAMPVSWAALCWGECGDVCVQQWVPANMLECHGMLQGMLQHTLLREAGQLDGMYAQAMDRIYNQVLSCSPMGIIDQQNNHLEVCMLTCERMLSKQSCQALDSSSHPYSGGQTAMLVLLSITRGHIAPPGAESWACSSA